MPLYECVFIARNDVTQQQVEAIAESVGAVVTEAGGSIKKQEYWGLRGLAYRIKKNRKGHYMLLGIEAPAPAMHEVERQLGLNEDVLREMTLRVERSTPRSPRPSSPSAPTTASATAASAGPKPAGRFASGRTGGGPRRPRGVPRPLAGRRRHGPQPERGGLVA
jgi:small subunit ribosomal protein S6